MDQNRLKNIINITKKLSVLYLEDNVDVRNQTLKMLNLFFEDIEVGTNGNEGLTLFKERNKYESTSFDLIITDIEMPEIDGISMINKIREFDKKIPILIFSAHSRTDYFLKTIDAGIVGYILKPYNIEQISNSLEKLIEKEDLSYLNEHILVLEDGFIWNSEKNTLYKNEEIVKLTKSELKLFRLFSNTKTALKSYDDIEIYIFGDITSNTKRVRNLMSRLKTKLDFDLFESIYGHGYKLKHKKD
ncbi:response regulator transcription factor [Halarcobacter anaerophilus]|uniref:response regulator transcription factor n=1 Tax=Halarcobacter anaerophilus TaxID=877500 RepID=UPI0005CB2788|nr:response regulator [Halarcobacter anaerophilus]